MTVLSKISIIYRLCDMVLYFINDFIQYSILIFNYKIKNTFTPHLQNYDNNLLLVENATYATKMDKPAAKISELTHGPLKAPGCETITEANSATL